MRIPCVRQADACPPAPPRFRSVVCVLHTLLAAGLLWLVPASTLAAATLTGRVSDPDGRVVPAARVIVTTAIGTVAEQLTDAEGRFRIDTLRDGRYDVLVVARGFAADPMAVTLHGDETREVDVALRISPLSESIVVSAAQVDVPLSRTPDTVTVVTAADLQARQIDTVADALRLVPGLAVARSGGRGAVTSLFPRGGGSNYTLVLVDGVRLNSFGGGYDFGHLAVGDIDRIEIVRGPQSALYGSDAVGGVVQIVTRRGGPLRADGLVEGGSQGTRREAVQASGSRRTWTWGAGAEQSQSDGFTGLAPADGERVSNDDDHLWRVSGSLGWQRPGGADLLLSGRVSRDERGVPGPYGSDPIGAFSGVDRQSRGVNNTRQVAARFSHPWSPRLRQRFDVNLMDLSSDFTSPFGPSTSGTRRIDGRVQEDVTVTNAVSGSVGVEFLRERGTSSFITGAAGEPIPIDRSALGAFAEVRYAGGERWSLTGGLRIDQLMRDRVEGSGSTSSPRPPFPEQSIASVNPKVSASVWIVPDQTRLHASAGTGIRPPDAFEISFTDNPNLKPERSRSVDAGIEQRLVRGTVVVGATAFFNAYDDLLVTVGTSLAGASRFQTDNISNARARGLELSGDVKLGPSVTLRAQYTFLSTETLSVDGLNRVAPPPFKVGDPLIRRPRHQGEADITYERGRVSAFGELTSRSRTLDVEPNFGSFGGLFFSSGYAVVNLGGAFRVASRLEVYGRVLNVANHAYEEVLGFPALGRSGIVGLRVATGR